MPNMIKKDTESLSFEDFKNENGISYWWASDLMVMLGYSNMSSFQKVLDRATKTFVSLKIPHYENIIPERRISENGSEYQDFKMTRFACYIAVMNADSSKVNVAQAQAYFAQQTRKYELYIQNTEEIERINIRDELAEGNKALSSAAKKAGVEDYASFTNAGYLGMYNMRSWELERRRKVSKGKLMEHMGRTELAANLFRVTQTEEIIKNKKVKGQSNLEATHYKVGREVRDIVAKNTGRNPENLEQSKKLPEVKKELKGGYRKMKNDDKKPKNSKG